MLENNKKWKTVVTKSGSRTRHYIGKCDFCNLEYEGRGAKFCSKSCATKWGRKNKDYSHACFKTGADNPNGKGLSEEKKKNLSKIMKNKWKRGEFVNTVFRKIETKLEKLTRTVFEKMQLKFKQKYWLNKSGWKPKEYDFYIPELHLLVEVDGTYWHSLPENIINDEYKNKFAAFMGYNLLRFPEKLLAEDAIRAAINDYKNKQPKE